MPKALEVNWDLIRMERAHGMTLKDIAEKHGVSEAAIRQRSSREKWSDMVMSLRGPSVSQLVTEAASSAKMSLLEQGQAYAARVFQKVSAKVDAANLPDPKNWKDMEIADKIARRASGLETAETQVNTIIGVGGGFNEPNFEAPIEAEVVSNPSTLEDATQEGSG
jgi:hypothetical protein